MNQMEPAINIDRTMSAAERVARGFTVAAFFVALGLIVFGMSGCAAPFNINTRAAVPTFSNMPEARAGGLEVQAQPVTDQGFLYNAFNSNPILAGLLPVWIKVSNSGEADVDLKKTEFALEGSGAVYKAVEPSKAFKRLLHYYQIKASSTFGYRQSRDNFESTSLDVVKPLAAGASREGYMFFSVPDSVAMKASFKLLVRKIHGTGGPESLEIAF